MITTPAGAAQAKEQRLVSGCERKAPSPSATAAASIRLTGAVAVATLGAERVVAIVGRSASYPASQWAMACKVARQIGLPSSKSRRTSSVIRAMRRSTNRCYFCKTELWTRLVPVARVVSLSSPMGATPTT
jgi:hypothetical protein